MTEYSNENSFHIDKIYEEKSSGTLRIEQRTILKEMLNYVILNDIKLVLISEASRLSRNLLESKKIIDLFNTYNVHIYIHNINMNTKHDFDYNILKESIRISECETKLFKSRMSSGYDYYIKNGGIVGRKKGYTKNEEQLFIDHDDIIQLIENGYSVRKIMKLTNKSSGTVMKMRKLLKEQ